MMKWMRDRLGKDEGFTLVELMVVVLIIAILVAIAIPSFLGLRSSAQDRSAQSNLRNGLTAAKTHYATAQTYADAATVLAAMQAIEPSLTFATYVAGTLPPVGQVHVAWESTSEVVLIGQSASGAVFCIADDAGPTKYNQAGPPAPANADALDTTGECGNAAWT